MATYAPIIRNVFDDPSISTNGSHIQKYPMYTAYLYKRESDNEPCATVITSDVKKFDCMIEYLVDTYHFIYKNNLTCNLNDFPSKNNDVIAHIHSTDTFLREKDIPKFYFEPKYKEIIDRR